MTDHAAMARLLGSYLAGALNSDDRLEVESHLGRCGECREELARLSALPAALARLSPSEFEAEDLAPPLSLLPGLLARAAKAESRGRHRLWAWRAVATAAIATTAAAGVVGLVAKGASSGPVFPLRPAVALAGLNGRVTLDHKPWGTEMVLSLSGLPQGTSCVAVVVGRDGKAQEIGNWGPTPTRVATVEVATSLSSGTLGGITIETTTGKPLLRADLAT